MLEMKVTITAATDLMAVLNNIAAALDGKNPHTVCNQFGTDNKHIDNVGTINMGVGGKAQPATPTAPVNPTPAPVATPAPAPGAPLSATPAQTATPIAPTVPVATPAPTVTPAANVAPVPAVPTSAPQVWRGKPYRTCTRKLRSRCKRIKSPGRSDLRRDNNANTGKTRSAVGILRSPLAALHRSPSF